MIQTVFLEDLINIRSGKSRPKGVGRYSVYGGNGVFGSASVSNMNGPAVIIGRVGAYCGSVYIEDDPFWLSDNALGVTVKDDVSLGFIYYLLKYLNLNTKSVGGAQPLLTQSILNSISVTVPDYKTQKKIAGILSSLDEKIELNRKMNETLEQMGQALFRHYFIDNPEAEKWEKVPISDKRILKIIKPQIEKFDGMKKYIATANVSNQDIVGNLEKISYSKRPSRANMQPVVDSIWFSKMIGEHKALIINDLAQDVVDYYILSTGFLGLKPRSRYLYYIWSYINSNEFATQKNSLATGAVMVALNNGSFSKIPIANPAGKVLDEFNLEVAELYRKISLNQQENQTLIILRDTLLPRLINGKVKI